MPRRQKYKYGVDFKILNYGGRPLVHKRGDPIFYGGKKFNTWEKWGWFKPKRK